jgi:WD40 repeat protein
MVTEVAGEPAALALLSFTASRLWELRDRRFRRLTAKAYRTLGGVAGALAQHAEETLTAMPAEEQRLVREVFRQSVTAEGTRAPLSPTELVEALGGGPHASAVVEKLVAARLLVVSDSELGKRIEIAHETLLDAWPRLVEWRREDQEGTRLRDLIRAAARQWEERGRSRGLLWRGDELAEYRRWRARHPGPLTSAEEAFTAASLTDAARGRRRRTLMIGGAVVALTAVAVALLILRARAEQQRSPADSARGDVEKSASQLHRQLLTQYERQGRRLVVEGDPLQGLAFLSEAAKLGARGVAHDFVVAQAVRATDGEVHLLEHTGPVVRVRFSPDGSRLVTAGYDNEARLWDSTTGALLGKMSDGSEVSRVAFSPDGALVASGTMSGKVVIWQLDGFHRLHELDVSGAPQAVEFSPDGALLLTTTTHDQVILWDARAGKSLRVLRSATPVPAGAVGAPAAFSRDGTRVALGGTLGGPVRVWEVSTGREVAALAGHTERVTAVRFSPDGKRLVSSSWDDTAIVWRLDRNQREWTLKHGGDVHSVSFSSNGKWIATASNDRTAIVWDADSGEPRLRLVGHEAGVTHAIFSPDDRTIATTSIDTTAALWDADTGERLARRRGHRATIRDISFSPDGHRIATASLDGSAIVWDTEPTWKVTALVGGESTITTAAFAPDHSHVATGGTDGVVRLWDRSTGRELLSMPGHAQQIQMVKFSPDGTRIASIGTGESIRIWDGRTGTLLRTLPDAPQELDWSRDGDRLVTGGADGLIRVWSTETGERLVERRAHDGRQIWSVAVAPSGDTFATSGDDRITRIWDLATVRERAHFADDSVHYSMDFDPSGARVVSATSKQSAKVWTVSDGTVVAELTGHVGDVLKASWAFGGRLVVTGSTDATARLWDPDSGDVLAVFPTGLGPDVARISPDGAQLLVAGNRRDATLIDLPRVLLAPRELDRLLRCRVPFAVDGNRVVSRPRDFAACRSLP